MNGARDKVLHALSLTDPKYLPMMTLPLLVPYLALGPVRWWHVPGGVVAVTVLNLGAVLVNTWSDREGDRLSFPAGFEATSRHVGYDRLPVWIAAAAASGALAAVVIAAAVSAQVAAIYVAGWGVAVAYSVGPRLKTSLLFSRLCIACGPTFAFAGGWALQRSLLDLPSVVVLLFAAQGINTLLKDVPDVDGDRRMGVRTLFTSVAPKRLRTLLPVLWTLPYLLAASGVLVGSWPPRYLAIWALWPVAIAVARSPLVVRSQAERELVRELAQVYASAWVVVNLVLFAPRASTYVACALGVALYLVVLLAGVDRRRQGHSLSGVVALGWRAATATPPVTARTE